jgi:hypothetical protein
VPDVVLLKKAARDEGDQGSGNDLLDEHHTPTPSIRTATPNVESQVDLVKISMKGKGNRQHPRVQETKCHECDEYHSPPPIKHGANGQQSGQERRIDLIVQHHEIPPLSREKNHLPRSPGVS